MNNNTQAVLIIGSSGHAKVIIDIFHRMDVPVIGLIDSFRQVGETTLGFPILGGEEDLPQLLSKNGNCKLFVAIGDNWDRQQVVSRVIQNNPDVGFASAIHPNAQIGLTVEIGTGVAIMAGVVINSGTIIEDFAIINTKASVDHDNRIQKFSSLAPNVATGGYVTIGAGSAIGISATVTNKVSIGSHSIIGAGALVLNDFGDQIVAYGVPAKEIGSRKIGKIYP